MVECREVQLLKIEQKERGEKQWQGKLKEQGRPWLQLARDGFF